MNLDIMTISNEISKLRKKGKRIVKSFSSSSESDSDSMAIIYGESGRIPYPYLETKTNKKIFKGSLPPNSSLFSIDQYRAFPLLSQEFLRELFASIGVKYIPEILLNLMKNKTPYEIFTQFCHTFSQNPYQISTIELNIVINKLKKMDELRKKYALNSKPVYKALAEFNMEDADKIIVLMAETVELLESIPQREKSHAEIFFDIEKNFLEDWTEPEVFDSFVKRYNLNV